MYFEISREIETHSSVDFLSSAFSLEFFSLVPGLSLFSSRAHTMHWRTDLALEAESWDCNGASMSTRTGRFDLEYNYVLFLI